jgi:hypothetical protein
MLARKLLVSALALVVLMRAVHCLHVDAEACAAAKAAGTDSPPLADPTDSDPNESGCLCKGAVFVAPCIVPASHRANDLLSIADFPVMPLHKALAAQSRPAADPGLAPSPVSGRMLRALIASWQI